MLQSFSIENFKSIKDTTLEFTFKEGKAPNGYKDSKNWIFLDGGKNVRLVPCLAIYGPNASGKTNLVLALNTLRNVVLRGVSDGYVPNRLIPLGDAGVFTLRFWRKKKSFQYRMALSMSEILEEELVVDGECLFSIRKDKVDFSGIVNGDLYSDKKLKQIRDVECCADGMQKRSYLFRLADQYHGLSQNVVDACDEIRNTEILLQNKSTLLHGMDKLASATAEPREHAFAKITELLGKLDFGITKLHYELNPASPENMHSLDRILFGNDGKLFVQSLFSYRQDINGNEVEFDAFKEESNGTLILSGLLGFCLYALESGSTLVVDELDRSLHPWILIEIVRLFKSKRYNKHNAQLIFTAHETELLDAELLRVSDVAIVEKTSEEGTRVRRIADFEGMRNVLNFKKQYLSGAFGALPYAYI